MSNENSANPTHELLQQAAQQAIQRPAYLASALETFKQVEQLNEAGLQEYLSLNSTLELSRLALCRRPDPANLATFRRDVTTIANRFGIAQAKLANLLRRVAAYETQHQSEGRYLMAARDRNEHAESEPPENG